MDARLAMTPWLFMPPIAFGILILAAIFLSFLAKRTSFHGPMGPGAMKPYACGEDLEENCFRPEYGQFFAFAFFFTIMHVVALVLATVPDGAGKIHPIALAYIAVVLIGLSVLMRKEG